MWQPNRKQWLVIFSTFGAVFLLTVWIWGLHGDKYFSYHQQDIALLRLIRIGVGVGGALFVWFLQSQGSKS
jgi:hypothetical protein